MAPRGRKTASLLSLSTDIFDIIASKLPDPFQELLAKARLRAVCRTLANTVELFRDGRMVHAFHSNDPISKIDDFMHMGNAPADIRNNDVFVVNWKTPAKTRSLSIIMGLASMRIPLGTVTPRCHIKWDTCLQVYGDLHPLASVHPRVVSQLES